MDSAFPLLLVLPKNMLHGYETFQQSLPCLGDIYVGIVTGGVNLVRKRSKGESALNVPIPLNRIRQRRYTSFLPY